MRFTRSVLAVAASGLFCNSVHATNDAGVLLCVADQVTGFKVDPTSKRWESTSFHPDQRILIVRSSKPDWKYEVRNIGSDLPVAVCKKEINDAGNLFCDGLGTEYRMNTKNLRYMFMVGLGYWNDDESSPIFKEGMNTPAIGIGKCSKL